MHRERVTPRTARRPCAVLVPIVGEPTDPDGRRILLLVRPRSERDPYAGQVCLPGGAIEPEDQGDLRACALREAHEEVGLPPDRVDVFDSLGRQRTSLHDHILPFAGRVPASVELRPSPAEVAELLWLPAARLRPELFESRGTRTLPSGERHELWGFDLDGYDVWGLTARVLQEFTLRSPAFRTAIGLDGSN